MRHFKTALIFGVYSLSLVAASVSVTLLAIKHKLFTVYDAYADPISESESLPEEAIRGPVAFYPIRPLFNINLPIEGKLRSLQVQVDIMTEDDAEALLQLQRYEPLIKSEILELLSEASMEGVTTEAGQSALRLKAFQSIRKAVKNHTGEDYVKQVLFTAFVVE